MSARARVVAGPRHDLRAEEVRLLLVVAAVAEQQRAETELGAFRDVPAQLAADDRAADRAGDLAELQPRVLGLRPFAVPCRSSTRDSSCAITPATSASSAAASNMPRCTNIGPPGSANALMSFRFTGVNEYS